MRDKRVYPTRENLEKIRRMTESGYSIREIANEVGCCVKSIQEWKREYLLEERIELQRRVADYLNSGVLYFSLKDLRRKLGVKSKELNYLIIKYRRLGLIKRSGRKWKVVAPIPRWIDYSQNTILPTSNFRKVKVKA